MGETQDKNQAVATGKVHRCMRCGGEFACRTAGCEAKYDVLPGIVQRAASGEVLVVGHECVKPTEQGNANYVNEALDRASRTVKDWPAYMQRPEVRELPPGHGELGGGLREALEQIAIIAEDAQLGNGERWASRVERLARAALVSAASACKGCRLGLPVEQTEIGPRHYRMSERGTVKRSFDCIAPACPEGEGEGGA